MSAPHTDTPTPSPELTYIRSGNAGMVIINIKIGTSPITTDKLDITKAPKRDAFAAELCEKCPGIDRLWLDGELLRTANEVATKMEHDANKKPTPEAAPTTDYLKDTKPEVKAAALEMLRDPKLIEIVVNDIKALGVAGERKLSATVAVVGTSRLLDDPLAVITQGVTASGKSYVPNKAACLFPPEAIIRAHSMTPQALVHLPPGALVHRFVLAGERSKNQKDEAADATRALREMLSDGNLSKLIPDKEDGKIVTRLVQQDGPIAYLESTTLQHILDEDRNRMIVVNTDEGESQTERILESMAERKAGATPAADTKAIIDKHHAAQRMLKRCKVVIPFAPILARSFPKSRTDARRSFKHLLSMIEAVALFYQYQRIEEPTDGCVIEATIQDYAIARKLLIDPFSRSQRGGMSDAAKNFYERLVKAKTATGDQKLPDTFAATDVAKIEKVIGDISTIRAYLKALASTGYLEIAEGKRGSKPSKFNLSASPPKAEDAVGLPKPEEVAAIMAESDGQNSSNQTGGDEATGN